MPLSFLQSAEWEGFERALGRRTWRAGNALVARRDLPLGLHYLYCPRPAALTDDFFAVVREISKKERSVFLKIDPAENMSADMAIRAGATLRPARAIQPAETIILGLVYNTENELLAAMHEKTRYNIRLAERKGVIVRQIQFSIFNFHSEKFEIFWDLLQETAQRDGFQTHHKGYYKKMLEMRSGIFSNELFLAEYGGEILAAAIVNYYRGETSIAGTATYLHGASRRHHREVMAPHLLQWRIIQEALRRGCARYDFWGIDERRWSGVTRFKRGFGGSEITYPQSVDIVYRPFVYAAYKIAKKIKS